MLSCSPVVSLVINRCNAYSTWFGLLPQKLILSVYIPFMFFLELAAIYAVHRI